MEEEDAFRETREAVEKKQGMADESQIPRFIQIEIAFLLKCKSNSIALEPFPFPWIQPPHAKYLFAKAAVDCR